MYYPVRVYVAVRVQFNTDGELLPILILWEDGRIFEIDRIIDICRAASTAGSGGLRYTVRIMGRERYLFYEDIYSDTGKPRWFLQSDTHRRQ